MEAMPPGVAAFTRTSDGTVEPYLLSGRSDGIVARRHSEG